MRVAALALICLLVSAPAPSFAHHSFAMFDPKVEVTLTGTVRELQWTNPHTWIELTVPAADPASSERWSVECQAPNGLIRMGWKPDTLKTGDKVVLKIHPLRDGSKGGSLILAFFGDGRPIGRIPGSASLPPGA